MNWLKIVWTRFCSLWQRPAVKREIDEELRLHLELRTAEHIAVGMSPEAAAREARKRFGNVQSIREECREAKGASFGEATLQDIRFGLRMLAKNPGFSAVIILTLGLGIGANTAIFSIFNAVVLRPLPYPKPEELVQVKVRWQHLPWATEPWETTRIFSGTALARAEEHQVFSQIAAYASKGMNLSGREQAERVQCGKVSQSFLPLFGAVPALGRNFLAEEDRPGGPAVAILSHGLWQRSFGGDTNILGQTIKLDEEPYTVVGVLGAAFKFSEKYDLLFPPTRSKSNREGDVAAVMGRLKPGVSLEQARSVLDTIFRGVCDPEEKKWGGQILVVNLQEHLARNGRENLWVFQVAVGFVLLIACANVANLLLARVAARRKEIAIRVAVGAGRRRIIGQLLTESVLMAILGGALGLLLTYWSQGVLRHFVGNLLGPNFSRVEVQMDGWVLAFTFLLALGTGLLFGIAPALETSRLSLNDCLKEGGHSAEGGLHRHRLSRLLVILEVALTLILLVGTGLLIENFVRENFVRMRGANLGWRPERLLTATINLTGARYPDGPSQAAYFEQVLERLRQLPGVEMVGANMSLPWTSFSGSWCDLRIEGRPSDTVNGDRYKLNIVSSDYFRAMGIPLIKGRSFTDGDRAGAPEVVVVSESFVRRYFPNEEPLGQRLGYGTNWLTIVGVAGDVAEWAGQKDAEPQFYTSYLQRGSKLMSLAIRTKGNPLKLAGAVRSQIQSVDKDQPVFDLMTMKQRQADAQDWVKIWLASLVAALALGLAALGIYGVLSYSVAQRTHEIGVRMALGARAADVVRLVVGQGMGTVLLGVIAGLVPALALTQFLRSISDFSITLFGLPTFVGVFLFLGVVVLAACYFPARRAAKIDPMVALRYE